jgi:hypothetical protein
MPAWERRSPDRLFGFRGKCADPEIGVPGKARMDRESISIFRAQSKREPL